MVWRIAALALILLSVQLPGAHAAHAQVPDLPASASMPAEHCDHGREAAGGATTAPQMPAGDGGCCDGSDCCGTGCAGACATTAALTESVHILPVLRTPVLQTAPDPVGHAPARPPDPFRPPI